MSQWDHLFTQYRQDIAQILLTRNDIADVSATEGIEGLATVKTDANKLPADAVSQCPEHL